MICFDLSFSHIDNEVEDPKEIFSRFPHVIKNCMISVGGLVLPMAMEFLVGVALALDSGVEEGGEG